MKYLVCLFLVLPLWTYSQDFDWTRRGVFKFYTATPAGDTVAGTAFIAQYKEGHYFITAKHLFQNWESGDSVWVGVKFQNLIVGEKLRVYFDNRVNSADIAIMQKVGAPEYRTPKIINPDTSFIGDDIIFWGFPAAIVGNQAVSFLTTDGVNISPLLKKGYISGYTHSSNNFFYVLDAQTAHGFSGGPIYRFNPKSRDYELIAVMAGGYPVNIDRMSNGDLKPVFGDFYMSSFSVGNSIIHAANIIESQILINLRAH